MKQRISKAASAALYAFCALIIGLTGCKEDTIITGSTLPGGDTINTVSIPDTMTIIARTIFDDSVVTSYTKIENTTSFAFGTYYQSAGSITTDPFFGKTHNFLNFQIAAPTTSFTFPDTSVIDSAVLILPYTPFAWGDTTTSPAQRLRVYQLADALTTDSIYYSKQRPNVDRSRLLGQTMAYGRSYRDSVNVWDQNRPPHLRVRLDTNFFMPALRLALAADTTIPDFVKVFKGLAIEPDTNQVASLLSYYNFLGGSDLYSTPGVVVYYHYGSGSNLADSQTASFPFNSVYTSAFTSVKRDYAGAPAAAYINNPAATNNVLLIQGEPGAAIDIRIPGVKNLPLGIYNKAQLVLTKIDTLNSDIFNAPPRIFPWRVQDDGSLTTIADRSPTGSTNAISFIDGTPRSVTIGGVTVTQYVVNLPREIQRTIVEKKNELHLRLNGSTNAILSSSPLSLSPMPLPGAYRFIGGGRSYPWKLSLNVAYSRQ